MRETYATPGNGAWGQARHSAYIQELLAPFTRRSAVLTSFGEVRQKLQLGDPHPLGRQDVALDQIVGSVSRYTDFTRLFYPRQDHLQERWQRIEQLRGSGRELPPVELYKVGQAYFVRDGNHRVSVARQHGLSTLKAIVWEYDTQVPLQPDSDIDDLLRETAHTAFVERTHIDHVRPGIQIELTQPDGYEDLLREIQAHQQIFSRIERRSIPSDEAVALWYELRYTPIVEIIRRRQILQHFSGRTETDLYLWLCRYRQELEGRSRRHILLEEAARDLVRRLGKNPLFTLRVKDAAGWLVVAISGWAPDWFRAFWPVPRRKSGWPTGG